MKPIKVGPNLGPDTIVARLEAAEIVRSLAAELINSGCDCTHGVVVDSAVFDALDAALAAVSPAAEEHLAAAMTFDPCPGRGQFARCRRRSTIER